MTVAAPGPAAGTCRLPQIAPAAAVRHKSKAPADTAGAWQLDPSGRARRMADYTAGVNLITKVLDFVQLGGPSPPWRAGRRPLAFRRFVRAVFPPPCPGFPRVLRPGSLGSAASRALWGRAPAGPANGGVDLLPGPAGVVLRPGQGGGLAPPLGLLRRDPDDDVLALRHGSSPRRRYHRSA